MTGPDDPAITAVAAHLEYGGGGAAEIVAEWLGDQIAALVAEPVPAGATGHLQNPPVCVPELVAEVAGAHGIGADAAALYLQLLALPDPTDRNVAPVDRLETGPAEGARAELAATDLVVEAKRRAGRAHPVPARRLARAEGPAPAAGTRGSCRCSSAARTA